MRLDRIDINDFLKYPTSTYIESIDTKRWMHVSEYSERGGEGGKVFFCDGLESGLFLGMD